MTTNNYAFDWSDLAFSSKKPLKELDAIFIAAPRELSNKRFKEIIKDYLPKGNIVLGIAKEPFVEGFPGQPQFRMLQRADIQKTVNQVNTASTSNHIYILEYFQRELPYILEKVPFKQISLINGSWKHVFHVSPSFYILAASKTPYVLISPFSDEQEARDYEKSTDSAIEANIEATGKFRGRDADYTERELIELAGLSALFSYDYSFQTGLCLAKKVPGKEGAYKFLMRANNRVVPFQTYAMHHGAAREKYFSPPNDLNHYDTVHAEVHLLTQALKAQEDLHGTTVFINLLPCPACARMLTETDIEEVVYSLDHSDGYALQMLEKAGKKIRRLMPTAESEL